MEMQRMSRAALHPGTMTAEGRMQALKFHFSPDFGRATPEPLQLPSAAKAREASTRIIRALTGGDAFLESCTDLQWTIVVLCVEYYYPVRA
eukprot:516035-Rhodomonas_salina.2